MNTSSLHTCPCCPYGTICYYSGMMYAKESEELMDELKEVAMEAIDRCHRKRIKDWTAIKSAIKSDISGYLYKTTKRNPMILPVIMEI